MIKRLTFTVLLGTSTLYGGFFDSVMEVVKSPEIQEMASSAVSSSTLVDSVTKDTGLDLKQSTNALSNILNYSKSNMSESEYNTVSKEVPGFEQLIAAGLTNTITSSEALNNSFKTMGIDPALIGTIVPIIIEYAKNSAGNDSADIISKSLSSLLSN